MRIRASLGIVAGATLIASALVTVAPAYADSVVASDLPGLLATSADVTSPAYNRDLFEHWIDADGDGCNTRYEVLIEESTTPVTVEAGCTLVGATWTSEYDSVSWTDPADVDIDHMVPLAEAWRSGAWSWTDDQRRTYANDLDVPYALIAVTDNVNQSKSDQDPALWMPSNTDYHCTYATGWALMKYRWSLNADSAELATLQTLLSGECGAAIVELPTVMVEGAQPEPPAETVIAPFTEANTRLGGADRYQVAIGISKRYSPNVPVVFIAKGSDFPDGLSAAAAASLLGGPLLLTPTADLHDGVAAEVGRLHPGKIVVVGGEGSVSPAVFNELKPLAGEIVRVGGRDRYETSFNITSTAFTSASQAMLATGRTFPDALAASGAAGMVGAPVILVDGVQSTVPARTFDLLHSLGVTTINIAGGPAAVSSAIETQIRNAGFAVTRYGGASRYEVAANINTAFFAGGAETGLFATGLNFPDALAGAALAGRLGAPLFITTPSCLPESVRNAADSLGLSNRVFLGGPASIGEGVVMNLGCISAGTPRISGSALVTYTLTANPGSWTSGTSLSYQWLANGAAIAGATGQGFKLRTSEAGKRISVRVTGSQAGYTTATRASGATGAVGYPLRTTPIAGTWNCPAWAPIKGNASSMIYHVPGGAYYTRTNPEECFRTESAAVAAGYRKSKL